MKKMLLLSSAFVLSTAGFAQLDSIKNPNFERWNGSEPISWGSSNAAYGNNGSVSKAIGGDILGTNTIVLTTKSVVGNPVPGVVVSNGTFALQGATPVIKGGAPYRMHPVSLKYVCKYTSGGGNDAPLVQVVLTKWRAAVAASGTVAAIPAHRDTLGISRAASNPGSNYGQQTLTISYAKNPAGGNPTSIKNYATGAVAPDSVQIVIASSNPLTAVANSTFFIDSLQFVYNCTINPTLVTSGDKPINIPKEGDTLTATAGLFSFNMSSYIPQTVNIVVPLGGSNIPLSTTVDSVKTTSYELSGSAADFMSIAANPTNGMAGGNSISGLSFSGTIPSLPANATYNLIITPIMWGQSVVASLSNFPSPQTVTIYIKVGSGSEPLASNDTLKWRTMMYNGNNRVYNMYVPSSYNGSTPVPLVFNIHGWTGSSTKQMDFGDFRPIADTANFIIVHPQALGEIPSWDLTGTSDTDYLMALLDTIEAHYNIDTNRVYSTGFSQGGMMSYLLGCYKSNRIAAIAPVAGGMTTTVISTCRPTHFMPLLEVHGDADILASYNGSGGNASVQQCVNYFVALNQCTTPANMTTLPNVSSADGSTVQHYVYGVGEKGSKVEHYKVLSGGHEWPCLAPATKNNYGLNNRNLDFSASKEIWNFLRQYRLDSLGTVTVYPSNTPTSIASYVKSGIPLIYPNPSAGKFTLDVKEYKNVKIKVTNVLGTIMYEASIESQYTAVDLSNAAKGVYLYQLTNETGVVTTGKMIVE